MNLSVWFLAMREMQMCVEAPTVVPNPLETPTHPHPVSETPFKSPVHKYLLKTWP